MKFQNKYNKQQGVAILDKENISDNSGITVNSEQIQALKDIFPNCFDKDGKFIKSKLDKALQDSKIDFAKESYTLDWLGKSYARLLANEKPLSVMSEDEDFNLNKTTENLLIKGDNLEVLKHLKNAYYKSIKMIYIDPPYNTGIDFVYQDDRKFTADEISQKAGVSEEEARRILEFIDKGSNSHSAWLTFMYPRLYVARQLLADDGVIFISIDDNEQAQLKMLCDEIFGEENFVAFCPVVTNRGGRDYGGIAITHEYLLIYQKDFSVGYLNLLEDEEKKFQYSDEKGNFNLMELRNRNIKFNSDNRPNLYYPFYINVNNKDDNDLFEISLDKQDGYMETYPLQSQGINTVWRWGIKKSREHLNAEIKAKKKQDGSFMIVQKYRSSLKRQRSVFDDVKFVTEKGSNSVKDLFGVKIFDYPKSPYFIQELIKLSTNFCNDDIVLDFFAGSGTTAQAIMTQNLEDGGNRKFILVQLDEKINEGKNKTAYDFCKNVLKSDNPTIFDITKERLIRAKNRLVEENQDKDLSEFDLDFRVYEIAKKDKFIEDMEKFNDTTSLPLYECDTNAIMTTWKLYDGIKLDKNLKEIKLKEYIAHYDGDKKLYLINPNFTHEDLIALIEKIDSDKTFKPNVIVIYGKHFESAMQNEICHNLNVITNTKSIELKIIIRDI